MTAPAPAKPHSARHRLVLLLLAVAVCAVIAIQWRRSYRRAAVVATFVPTGYTQVATGHQGQVIIAMTNLPIHSARSRVWASKVETGQAERMLEDTDANRTRYYGWGDFGVTYGPPGLLLNVGEPIYFAIVFKMPFWFLQLIAALIVLRLALLWRTTRRRQKHGLCAHCGYDLRESGAICPECGTARPVAPADP